MKKLFGIVMMVAIVAPLGQCQTFRRVPSESGTVEWELKLEDVPTGEYQRRVEPTSVHRDAASGFGQTVGKTYTPKTYYERPRSYHDAPTYHKEPVHAVVPEVHQTHYQPRYQPHYHAAIKEQTAYHPSVPTAVRTPHYKSPNFVTHAQKKEYSGSPHYHG